MMTAPRPLRCFVIMPAGNGNEYEGHQREANYIFDAIISPAVKAVSTSRGVPIEDPRCAVLQADSGNITDAIIRDLDRADIVIADLTGHNPNVYFELGIRYSRQPSGTILLMQKGDVLPFDVRPQRTIFYSMKRWDPEDAYEQLENALNALLDSLSDEFDDRVDSPVFRALPNLDLFDYQIATGSSELRETARRFRRSWRFPGSIAVVASSVETQNIVNKNHEWLVKHFTHATGSGQFYALELLLPPLAIAYSDRTISMHLAHHLDTASFGSSDLILLGGAPTNKKTEVVIDDIKGFPYRYDPPTDENKKDFAELIPLRDGKPFSVTLDKRGNVATDFGVILWTRLPQDPSRRLLLLFGGTTFGTEAAVSVVIAPPEPIRSQLVTMTDQDSFVCVVQTKVKGSRSDGKLIEEPEWQIWRSK